MNFSLPSVKVKPSVAENIHSSEGSFGLQNLATNGLARAQRESDAVHPLQASESRYRAHKDMMNMRVLRNTQGLHAPLRISMELSSARKIGRLPFLPSSNVMEQVLTGRDLEIGPEDIFNTPEFIEYGVHPHAFVEESLKIM